MILVSEDGGVRVWETEDGETVEQVAVLIGRSIEMGVGYDLTMYEQAKEMLHERVLNRATAASDEPPIGEVEFDGWHSHTITPIEGEDDFEPFNIAVLHAEVGVWPRMETP